MIEGSLEVKLPTIWTDEKQSRGIEYLPSGKHTKNYGKIHHAINGKTHYFDWAIFNSKLLNYYDLMI